MHGASSVGLPASSKDDLLVNIPPLSQEGTVLSTQIKHNVIMTCSDFAQELLESILKSRMLNPTIDCTLC